MVKTNRVQLYLDDSVHKMLKEFAKKQHISMSKATEMAIRSYINREDFKKSEYNYVKIL